MNEKLNPDGVKHEADFWTGFVKTERFKGWVADSPTPELDKRVLTLVQTLHVSSEVLDVGSGPVSILHGANAHVTVTACDPLSEHYQNIFDYSPHLPHIMPPQCYLAEDLPEDWFRKFDMVHISNALDHTVDPYEALVRLLQCVKPGGLLVVQGFVREADWEKRAGFHQHNLYLSGADCLSIETNRNHTPVTAEQMKDQTNIACKFEWAVQERNSTGRDWFIWVISRLP